jgi:hypothetical protein
MGVEAPLKNGARMAKRRGCESAAFCFTTREIGKTSRCGFRLGASPKLQLSCLQPKPEQQRLRPKQQRLHPKQQP